MIPTFIPCWAQSKVLSGQVPGLTHPQSTRLPPQDSLWPCPDAEPGGRHSQSKVSFPPPAGCHPQLPNSAQALYRGKKSKKFLAVLHCGFWGRHANAHRALMRAGEQGGCEAETPTAKLRASGHGTDHEGSIQEWVRWTEEGAWVWTHTTGPRVPG